MLLQMKMGSLWIRKYINTCKKIKEDLYYPDIIPRQSIQEAYIPSIRLVKLSLKLKSNISLKHDQLMKKAYLDLQEP